MRRWMKIVAPLSLMLGQAGLPAYTTAMAQDVPPPPEAVAAAPEDDDCEPANTFAFSVGTSRLGSSAQADLAAAANWVMAEPGRYLVLVGGRDPNPANAQLGALRASTSRLYLSELGVGPVLVRVGSPEQYLTPAEEYAMGRSDSVVILECVPVEAP